ncbi:mammalian cell entry protein, partial [Mycobacterium sp. WUMAC-067]|uniref:MCE family protein n=2 Tax=unclassified Mycobacterium TaxID=2642494 RepID=UPI001CD91E07
MGRTTTPYTLNNALQDLGKVAGGVDSEQLAQAMGVLTDALHEATPQLRSALEGITALSKTINNRDERIGQLLSHTQHVSQLLADRAGQINQLIGNGRDLFAALAERRQQLGVLISGIRDVARQISGFIADNRTQLGPSLKELNLVLDNLNSRQTQIGESLKRLPVYSTELGEVVGSGPGFSVNTYGLPPAT